MRSFYFVLLVVVAFLHAGCDATSTQAPASSDAASTSPVLPLAVGHAWTLKQVYLVTHQVQDGVAESDTTADRISPNPATLHVTRDTLIDGEQWFRMEPDTTQRGRIQHNIFGQPQWLTNRPDGLYRLADVPTRIYATDTAPSVPFIDSQSQVAVLLDPAASYVRTGQDPVEARAYQRTFRYMESEVLGDQSSVPEGPISPAIVGTEYMSQDLGIVALDVLFVTYRQDQGWIPSRTYRWEVSSFTRR